MIKPSATRLVCALVLVGGLTAAPLLNIDQPSEAPRSNEILAQKPEFEVRWQRGQLRLSGHTLSTRHESELQTAARIAYQSNPVVTQFKPLGIVPSYWADATARVISLLATTESARAHLMGHRLTLEAVITNRARWTAELASLRGSLPQHVTVDSDVFVLDPSVNTAAVCSSAFATFDAGHINFEESSDTFRSSALPRLDRVIALAEGCQHADVRVTGHTDASGNEEWNQVLSLKRAEAVGDYLVRGGISRERLRIVGAGSSAPIADNNTRYGRSQNRRIEIQWTDADRT